MVTKLHCKEATIAFEELKQSYKNAVALIHTDSKTALELVNETIDKAIELEVPEYVVQGTIFKAWCVNLLGRSNEALDIFNEAKHLHQRYTPNNKDHLSQILLQRGLVYLERGNYQLALDGFLGSLPLFDVEKRAVYANKSCRKLPKGRKNTTSKTNSRRSTPACGDASRQKTINWLVICTHTQHFRRNIPAREKKQGSNRCTPAGIKQHARNISALFIMSNT